MIKELINNIKARKNKFIKKIVFEDKIKDTIKNFFPNLNQEDIDIIEVLTIFTIDFISFKYGFGQDEIYYLQWQQNNCSDIKGVILLLLPFIDDKNNSYLLKNISDLNHMLYSKSERYIPNKILDLERDGTEGALQTNFKYGNMGLSLLPFEKNKNTDILLDLYPNNEKLIYKVIENNFYGLIQTIEIINGKSYINWVNIQPLNLNNYHDSSIYKSTVEYLENHEIDFYVKLSTVDLDYSGLWLGDYYNVIRNKFYEECKHLKWLFFPYDLKYGSKYLIQILNPIVKLENIINHQFNNFDDLDEYEQLEFKKILINLLDINLNTSLNISVITSTIFWFINNYSNRKIMDLENDYIKKFVLKKEDEMNNDKKEYNKDNINSIDVLEAFKFIIHNLINHFWNFLNQSTKQLIVCCYGKYLFERDIKNRYIINNNFIYKPLNKNNKEKISRLNIKNIYNIAKSLSNTREDNKEWIPWDKNYISLKEEYRILFFKRITTTDNNKWFNIEQNYKKEIMFNPDKNNKTESEIKNDYYQYKREILHDFKYNLETLIFEELVSTGILNKFTPNINITDKSRLPQNTILLQKKRKDNIKKMFKDNKKDWEESYYYLTNEKFKYMNKLKNPRKQIINPNDKYEEKNYFDIISEEQEWTNFYAMNWISQISFFQHYIFHQVLYVTGATGQGKSTQVPKLLLYALKMYDYNSKGNVICTQPRITPTVENATRIAEELGLPIEEISNKSVDKIKTDNYYIQYKYERGEHTKNKSNHLSLKIVTDGTLLEIIKSNPILKKNNDENINVEGSKELSSKYSNNNYYDIIIVDEAHEHNINMDIIIALSKQSCYFNNQVKLIIVSATMDDDEPIYRSYFKCLNDKLVYPIKSMIINPFLKESILLDPVYMDRRYHISPPGETTQYKVNEIYLENDIKGNTHKEISKKAQELGYEKIIEICNKSSNGEILFFCNGKKEILDAVEYLNFNMPQGNIALPFFSEMNETYKEIITKINSKIYNIKNRRENIHLEWNEKYIEDLTVPAGLYKRAVIIATNVAEASVTIPGLTFVIDNGYAKENTFNPKLGISKLIVDLISESSRLQRKGRVGRVSDGTVYYLYKKDARKNVKPKYKITQQDIIGTVISLANSLDLEEYQLDPETYKYKKFIVSNILNPNKFSKLDKTKLDETIIKDFFTNKYLIDIYLNNYRINNYFLTDKYYEFFNKKEFVMNDSLSVFENGQTFDNLLDRNGQFYLIHSFENSIKRNVLNNIIKYENKHISYIPLNEFKYFLRSLIDNNLIIDFTGDALYLYNDDIINVNRKYEKTELSTQIMQIKKDFDIDKINDAITLIAASAMGCLNQILEIRIFLELITNLPSNLMIEYKKWDNFKNIYTSYDTNSDILFIYKIIKEIKSRFSHLLVFNINDSINKKLDTYIDEQVKNYKKLVKKSKEPPLNYDGKKWNKLRNLEINGTLTLNKKELFLNESSTTDFVFNDIENYRKEIESWASTLYFKPEIIISFIKKLGWLYLNKIEKLNNNKVVKWSKNFTNNFNKLLTDHTIEEKIIRSFVYGNPVQFTFNESNKLKTLINFSLYDVELAIPFYSKHKMSDSLANVDDFIFYLNFEQVESLDDDEYDKIKISILNKIKPIWLSHALPLVHNPMFNNIYYDTKNNSIKHLDSYTINKLNKEFTNGWSTNNFVWNLSDKNIVPLMHIFYKSIIGVLNKFIH